MNQARLLLLAAALLFSSGGAAIKYIGLSAWQIAGFRSLIALVALLALLPPARRLFDRRVWVVAISYGATLVCFVVANKLTTAANAIYLQATAPIYVVLLSPILLKEPARRQDLTFMAALSLGLLLFFLGAEPKTATAPDPLLGNVIGVLAGIFWALTMMGLRWLARDARRDASLAAVAAGNVIAFLIAAPFAWPVPMPSLSEGVALGWLGVFQIGLAYLCMVRGMRNIPALESSLLLLLEPILSPLWAFLIHRELPGPIAMLGCLVILSATLLHSIAAARQRRRLGPGTHAVSPGDPVPGETTGRAGAENDGTAASAAASNDRSDPISRSGPGLP